MKKISVIIPMYNEEEALPILYRELCAVIDALDYEWEILFVNDGSRDGSLQVVMSLREKDDRVNYIDLSRNFGKENAMLAGFDYVTGDCAIVMDADLQHPPYVLKELIARWEDGYDDVYAKRTARTKEPWLRRVLSNAFYSLLSKLSKIEMLPNVGDFRLLDRKCIDALKSMRESERYSKGLFCWIGFKKCSVNYEQAERVAGRSSWNYFGLMKLAFDGLFSFSTFPLKLASITGCLVSLAAFVYMIYVLVKALLYGDPVAGYPTLITVILFLGGMILLCLGIIGEYVGRIFNEVKNRPVYLAREFNGKPV